MPIKPATMHMAPKVESAPTDPEKKKLKEACRNFEALFVAQLLKEMRPQEDNPIFGGSQQRKIYESMGDDEMARHLTQERSPLGVGDLLYRQLVEKLDATEGETAKSGIERANSLRSMGQVGNIFPPELAGGHKKPF